MSNQVQIHLNQRAPTPENTVAVLGGGGWLNAETVDFLVVARYWTEQTNLYSFGAYNWRRNYAGTAYEYPDSVEIKNRWGGVVIGLANKITIDWNAPDSRQQPVSYCIYKMATTGAGYDPSLPGELMAPDGYPDGIIPGNVTSVTINSDLQIAPPVLFDVVKFDSATDEIYLDGNHLVSFGDGVLFVISGTASNNGTKFVDYSYLAWTQRGVQTIIKITGTVTAESPIGVVTASVGPATFLQTNPPERIWGVLEFATLSNIGDLLPTARQLIGGTVDGGKTKLAFVDDKITERLALAVDHSGVTGDDWRKLCLWARDCPDVMLRNFNSSGGHPAFGNQIGKLAMPNHYADTDKNSLDALRIGLEVTEESA